MPKPIRHVAVNTRLLLGKQLEGIGRFSDEVLKRMVRSHPEVEFSFFFDREYDERYIYGPNVKPYVLFPPARHPFLFILFFEWAVARKLSQLKPDVFFSPDGYLSLRSSVPQVPVFHDIAFEHFPQDVKKMEAWHYRKYFPRFAKKAAKIITVSEYTKQDVIAHYHVPEDKFTIVGNACDERFQPSSPDEIKETRDRYSDGERYFHCVGAIQPRKNLDRLIAAFDRFKTETQSPMKLLVVGRKAWNFDQVIHSYSQAKFKEDIVFTGFVSDEELVRIHGASSGLCYVPYFEGFGIPLVEAMACEAPIICSNVTAMPGVVGDAALMVDPLDIQSIVEGLKTLASNPRLASELVDKGRVRKRLYTWEGSAERVWNVLTSV
ncbi:MAG: glycosyltransferase family 1 protein [Bacteroidia bacterium]